MGISRTYEQIGLLEFLLKDTSEVISGYKLDNGTFPSNLEVLFYNGDRRNKLKFNAHAFFHYKEPEREDVNIIILWGIEPILIRHNWLPLRSLEMRPIGWLNGTIETISEEDFQRLMNEQNIEVQK